MRICKKLQIQVNNEVLAAVDRFNEELNYCSISVGKRLRSCQAYVYETPSFYVLRSYNTVVAIIEKSSDTCYDFLRGVYGYTNTSAQHISKFDKDYGRGTWGCKERVTYREV
jgi:hypothetical protein